MKISIENLGPIKSAEFERKPLTVFIGDNRQGKTQALHMATVMLGEFGYNTYINNYLSNPNAKKVPELEKIYDSLKETRHATLDMVKFAKDNVQDYLDTLGELSPSCLRSILGFENTGDLPKINFQLNSVELKQIEVAALKIQHQIINDNATIKSIKEMGDPTLHFYTDSDATLPKTAIMQKILSVVIVGLQSLFVIGRVYQFPSERAGFTSLLNNIQKNPFEEQKRFEVTKDTANENGGDGGETLPYPLVQYMGMLHQTLMFGSVHQRLHRDKDYSMPFNWQLLVEKFNQVTGDAVVLSKQEPEFPRKIQIKVRDTALDVRSASSGVKGLTGLSLYLQYLSKMGDAIVIDEPEQNLHPTQQAKFIEFLTLLVNHGVHVAITTHSPYIIEHLENLILSYDINDAKHRKSIAKRGSVSYFL